MNKIDKMAENIVISALMFIGLSSLAYFSLADAVQKPINPIIPTVIGLAASIAIFFVLQRNEV
jgi:FtsH-binding integral membrane protein